MTKKQVSFFERVKIREIPLPYNSSDEFNLSDDELYDSETELEYHMDLEKDSGDSDDVGYSERNAPMTSSRQKRFSSGSNNHIVDFSGKVYASASQQLLHSSQRRHSIPSKFLLLPKMDRWQSQSQSEESPHIYRRLGSIDLDPKELAKLIEEDEERTASTTSMSSNENDSSEMVLGHSSSSSNTHPPPPPPLMESPSMALLRKNNRNRLGRIKEDHSINHYFRPHSTSKSMRPPRRLSFTGPSMRSNRCNDPSPTRDKAKRRGSADNIILGGGDKSKRRGSADNSILSPNSLYKSRRKITSAPSLNWFKSRSRKPSFVSAAESQNSTFTDSKYSNNRPPTIPSRNKTLLETINNNSEKSLSSSLRSHETSTTLSSEDDNPATIVSCCSDIESNCEEDEEDDSQSLQCEDGLDESDRTPEKPSSFSSLLSTESSVTITTSNRRTLLQRGFGSLRSLTSKSPRSKKKKMGKNDFPPVRPIRTTSVRTLSLDSP